MSKYRSKADPALQRRGVSGGQLWLVLAGVPFAFPLLAFGDVISSFPKAKWVKRHSVATLRPGHFDVASWLLSSYQESWLRPLPVSPQGGQHWPWDAALCAGCQACCVPEPQAPLSSCFQPEAHKWGPWCRGSPRQGSAASPCVCCPSAASAVPVPGRHQAQD